MLFPRRAGWMIAVGVLLACAPAARSDEWVNCKRDASTGPLQRQREVEAYALQSQTGMVESLLARHC